ncbi:MAG: Dickkopf N-terminal cysteine-rich domain-containing protein [Myxococcota bacterium]
MIPRSFLCSIFGALLLSSQLASADTACDFSNTDAEVPRCIDHSECPNDGVCFESACSCAASCDEIGAVEICSPRGCECHGTDGGVVDPIFRCADHSDCLRGQLCYESVCADLSSCAERGGEEMCFPSGCRCFNIDGGTADGGTGRPPACGFDGDCRRGELCIDNRCVRMGAPPPLDGGASCFFDADCGPGAFCDEGACRPLRDAGIAIDMSLECASSADCASGQSCVAGVCVRPADGSAPRSCRVPTDCRRNEVCIDSACTAISVVEGGRSSGCSASSEGRGLAFAGLLALLVIGRRRR